MLAEDEETGIILQRSAGYVTRPFGNDVHNLAQLQALGVQGMVPPPQGYGVLIMIRFPQAMVCMTVTAHGSTVPI